GRYDAKYLPPYPRAAAFVAERRSPAAAARERASGAASECDGTRACDQENAGAIAERIIECDARVGVHYHLLGQFEPRQRLPQRLTLRLASHPRHADAEDLGHRVRHSGRLERISDHGGDHLSRPLRLSRANRARGALYANDLLARLIGNKGTSA